jgi:peptidoglycan hydrolase-like protein with peptidoglycan-binding domain
MLRELGKLPPGAREEAGQAIKVMVRRMVELGQLPPNAAGRIVRGVDRKLGGLERSARRNTRRMMEAIGNVLKAEAIKLLPGVDAIGKLLGSISDPKSTGLPRKELLRRLLNLGSSGGTMGTELFGEGGRAGRTMPMTREQIMRFQRNVGLPVDGIVGPQTKAAAKQRDFIIKAVDDTTKSIKRNQRETERHTKATNSSIERNSSQKWQDTRRAIREAAQGAQREAGASFDTLHRQAMANLVKMGYSRSEATNLLRSGGRSSQGPSSGTASGNTVPLGPPRPMAGGGRIPGRGLKDTVPVYTRGGPVAMAAPGELIVNRHTENRVKQRYGVDLGREVAGEKRPHYAPSSPEYRRMEGAAHALTQRAATGLRLALGPYSMPPIQYDANHAGGNSHLHIAMQSPALAKRVAARMQTMGWSISEATWAAGGVAPGVHASPEHYDGRAFDANTASDETAAEVAAVARLLGGGKFGAAGAAAMAMMGGLRLKRMRSKFGGAPGGMSQAAMDTYRKAILKKANAAGGPGGAFSGAGLVGGNAAANMRAGHRMMLQRWGEDQWPALRELWMRESGWRNVMNMEGSGATGIPQALPGSKMASAGPDWRTNPITQIKWGLGYIADRYGSPSAALAFHNANNWYAQGGRLPAWGGWNARGGRFSVNGPTVFGAGEGGPEDVTIKPRGKAGVRPAPFQVNVKIENYNRKGDIAAHMEEEMELLAEAIAQAGEDE